MSIMKKNKVSSVELTALRRKAEERLQKSEEKNQVFSMSPAEMHRIIHELSVHQIELEMQQEELLQSRDAMEIWLERYTELYDFAPVGYLTLARDSTILEVNLTATIMLGVDQLLLKGARFALFVEHEGIKSFNALMERVFTHKEPRFCEVVLLRKENLLTPHCTVRIEVVIHDDGQSCRAVLSDVTCQKQIERENAKLQANLVQMQKMEMIEQLAGGIAHDFNNMLRIILNHAEMGIEASDPTTTTYADFDAIREAANRSVGLTRKLLAFARKQIVTPQIIELNTWVAQMLPMLQHLVGEHIKLIWIPGCKNGYINIDPSQIDEILVNLCINARDAITGNGRITIESSSFSVPEVTREAEGLSSEYVSLSVQDDGCGIGQNDHQHIFEPFFTTKEQGQGTGLGLSTIYGIVKQNNGTIECLSETAKGTTITIRLPLYKAQSITHQEAPPEESIMKGHQTILLVENELGILKLCKLILERNGYTILAFERALDALKMAERYSGTIDLLVTDVIMPEMNGSELSRKLLAMRPDLKILFISGYTADVIVLNSVLDHQLNFLQKPFNYKALTTIVYSIFNSEVQ
jgi:two-component system, cell cycle sensor histidine kinase and response regulator CckA